MLSPKVLLFLTSALVVLKGGNLIATILPKVLKDFELWEAKKLLTDCLKNFSDNGGRTYTVSKVTSATFLEQDYKLYKYIAELIDGTGDTQMSIVSILIAAPTKPLTVSINFGHIYQISFKTKNSV